MVKMMMMMMKKVKKGQLQTIIHSCCLFVFLWMDFLFRTLFKTNFFQVKKIMFYKV